MTGRSQIIYYDYNDLYFSSFYLSGFIENANEFDYDFVFSRRVPPLLFILKSSDRWRKLMFSICLFRFIGTNEEYYFCIDTRDSYRVNNGDGFHLELLDNVKYYFKVNYNKEYVDNEPCLFKNRSKIMPVLPFSPLINFNKFKVIPRLTPCDLVGWTYINVLSRLKSMNSITNLNEVMNMRSNKKELDIFFVTKFYDQAVHRQDIDFRYELIRELENLKTIKIVSGFVSEKILPGKFERLRVGKYSLREYLKVMSKTKIAIYVRGLHDCLSFKLSQILSLGLPIVGQNIKNNIDNIMSNDKFDEQFIYESPQDIAKRVDFLLKNNIEANDLASSNCKTYDSNFTPKAVVVELLLRILNK